MRTLARALLYVPVMVAVGLMSLTLCLLEWLVDESLE